jgi:hypothetical protein
MFILTCPDSRFVLEELSSRPRRLQTKKYAFADGVSHGCEGNFILGSAHLVSNKKS